MSPNDVPSPPEAGPRLEAVLDRFFTETAPLARGDALLVAFSGGPDSTALLDGALRLARRNGFEVTAAHLDHALDADSARRAGQAASLADKLGANLLVERLSPSESARQAPRGIEDWARGRRYDFLERCRRSVGARWIATAHHRDDQIETVLLRPLDGKRHRGPGSHRATTGSAGPTPARARPPSDSRGPRADRPPAGERPDQRRRPPLQESSAAPPGAAPPEPGPGNG